MPSKIVRILIGLVGVLSVLTALQHWFMLDGTAATRGFSGLDLAGRANFRADVGGIFLAIGASHLLAAWLRSAHWALVSASVIAMALLGRLVALALDGSGAGIVPPLVVEIVCLGLSLLAWRLWKDEKPEGL